MCVCTLSAWLTSALASINVFTTSRCLAELALSNGLWVAYKKECHQDSVCSYQEDLQNKGITFIEQQAQTILAHSDSLYSHVHVSVSINLVELTVSHWLMEAPALISTFTTSSYPLKLAMYNGCWPFCYTNVVISIWCTRGDDSWNIKLVTKRYDLWMV